MANAFASQVRAGDVLSMGDIGDALDMFAHFEITGQIIASVSHVRVLMVNEDPVNDHILWVTVSVRRDIMPTTFELSKDERVTIMRLMTVDEAANPSWRD